MLLRLSFFYFVWRFAILLAVIALERVVGLPILFLGLLLAWIELAEPVPRWILAAGGGLMLAISYLLPLTLSLVLVAAGVVGILLIEKYVPSFGSRLLLVVLMLSIVVGVFSEVRMTLSILGYAFLSTTVLLFSIRGVHIWGWR